MLFPVLFTLIATVTATFANVLSSGKQSSEFCSRELEGIVYTPVNCGFSYLKTISKELTVQAPLLFSSQAQSVLDSFAAAYDVEVSLINAMGRIAFSSAATISPRPIRSVTIARAMALGEGFSSILRAIAYLYILRNIDGKMYVVRLVLAKDKAPIYC